STPTATPTASVRPTATATQRASSPTATPAGPTNTPAGPTATATAANSTTATASRTATIAQTLTPTASAPPTATLTATNTAAPTATTSPSPTATTQVTPSFCRAPALTDPSGPRGDGTAVLPNGRIVVPAGRHAIVATLPTNLRVGSTGHLFVTNDGNGNDDFQRYLQVVEPQSMQVGRTISQHIYGLAVHPDGQHVYVANGPADRVDVFTFDGVTTLTPVDGAAISFPAHTFPFGLDLSADGNTLYVSGVVSNTFWRVDLRTGTPQQAKQKIGNFPYTVLLGRDGRCAYVSSWGISNGNNVQPSNNVLPAPLPPTDPNNVARSSVAVVDVSGDGAPSLVQYVPIARIVKFDPKNRI